MGKKKPSMLDMLKNFAKEVKDYAKEGAPNVTEEVYEKRLGECDACEHLRRDAMRCGKCGCLVEHKAKWATSSCPDKRWLKEVVGASGKAIALKKNERLEKIKAARRKRRDGRKGNSTTSSN